MVSLRGTGHDHNGNRLTKTANGIVETYTYDNADKLQTRNSSNGNYSYTYDNCGRTSTISGPTGTRTFTWDYEDRLTNLSGGGVPSTNYGYNGVGARTTKSNSTGSRTYKRNGVGVTAPVLSDGVATMVPGIAEKSGGVTNTVLTDRMGSTKALSSSGTASFTADYDAFGKVVSTSGSTSTQKGFVGGAGYQEDGESGYKLLGHRYYDSESGRFLTRDRSKDGTNWYSYVNNNPLKAIDASGLSRELKNQEMGLFYKWVALLIQQGYYEQAALLMIMMKEGRIRVDDRLSGSGYGGGANMTGTEIVLSPELFGSGIRDEAAAGLLLHEASHIGDHSKGGILYGMNDENSRNLEADAFRAMSEVKACDLEIEFLVSYLLSHPRDTDEVTDRILEVVAYQAVNYDRFFDDLSMLGFGQFTPRPRPVTLPIMTSPSSRT